MIKRFMRNWRYSDTEERMLSIVLFLLVILAVGGLIYVIYSIVYPKTLDYKDRPAVVKAVSHYSSSAMIPIKSGNNVTVYSPVSSSGDTVTYEDENGKRFSEDFSGGTTLVVGDKVITSVGYKNDEETDYVEFVERTE